MRLPRGYLEAGRKRTRGQDGTAASGHLGKKLAGAQPRQLMGSQDRQPGSEWGGVPQAKQAKFYVHQEGCNMDPKPTKASLRSQ